jgi:hypothetical protein
MPPVQGQLIKRCADAQIGIAYPVVQCAALSTQRTVANADVVEVHVYFELHLSAVTGTLVGFFHDTCSAS